VKPLDILPAKQSLQNGFRLEMLEPRMLLSVFCVPDRGWGRSPKDGESCFEHNLSVAMKQIPNTFRQSELKP